MCTIRGTRRGLVSTLREGYPESTMSDPLRPPNGLAWAERSEPGAWHGRAQAQFTGRQALRMIGLLLVGFFSLFVFVLHGGAIAALVSGVSVAGAAIVALRRPVPIRFQVGAVGFIVGDAPPVSPIAGIVAFDVARAESPAGTQSDRLVIHLKDGRSWALAIYESDPVYLRFVASRLNAALERQREPYRG